MIEHPSPSRRHHDFRDWLASWLMENPEAMVLPIDEAVVHAASHIGVDSSKRIVIPPSPSLAVALSKYHATRLARNAGVAIPGTHFLRAPGTNTFIFPENLHSFPKLLKWDNGLSAEAAYEKGGNVVVHSSEQLREYCAELAPYTCGLILQDLVPGEGVGAFFLRHQGEIVLRFAHRRLHEVPWPGGVSAFCESSEDQEVMNAGEKLLEAINYEGVAMVEFRKAPGKPPLFLEINGRLWGSLGLALAAGADFPRAMVECHLHGKTQVSQPDLSRRVRWREPKLELDYLHSLWEKKPGPCDPPAPRLRGTLSVLWNMIDPRITSDWRWGNGFWSTLRRHLLMWRRESARIKATLRQKMHGNPTDPSLADGVTRSGSSLKRASKNPPKNLLFLCYGNICRSPYAEFRWRQWAHDDPQLPTASSAGFHERVERSTPARFQSAARHRGVELQGHRSKRVTQVMVDAADWILVMDPANLRQFQNEFPAAISKILLLGACDSPTDPVIPDPYDQPIGAGGLAYRRIDAALESMRASLKPSACSK